MTTLPQLMTPSQVADYIGVTRTTVYRWITAGTLTCVHLPGGKRIKREQLIQFLDSREK